MQSKLDIWYNMKFLVFYFLRDVERHFTKFEQPAFSVRVEKGVSQIVPIILWDFERLVAYALIQFLKGKEIVLNS